MALRMGKRDEKSIYFRETPSKRFNFIFTVSTGSNNNSKNLTALFPNKSAETILNFWGKEVSEATSVSLKYRSPQLMKPTLNPVYCQRWTRMLTIYVSWCRFLHIQSNSGFFPTRIWIKIPREFLMEWLVCRTQRRWRTN